jgi:hypothetical protein
MRKELSYSTEKTGSEPCKLLSSFRSPSLMRKERVRNVELIS